MPINTDLNIAPYFDDFDLEKQFYKILFKPAYAVQARELTQLQSILQNQIEQFGDNVYKEGSIIKGCNFTNLSGLEYVKVINKEDFDIEQYISGPSVEVIAGVETLIDVVYEIEGDETGLKASVVSATRGFETRPPDLNTFYINYLNSTTSNQQFNPGESLSITRKKYNGKDLYSTEPNIETISVTVLSEPTGKSFGIQASAGVIFQKGHFLFAGEQTLIVSKYTDQPDDLSVGYEVDEALINALQDESLYDNANGSNNQNAPGADRLKLVPRLVVKDTAVADVDATFFTLVRYQNGSAVTLRDVSQFNSIAEELAKRTYEESGNYIVENFKVDMDRRGPDLTALVGAGIAYVKGYRAENGGKVDFVIDQITKTATQANQAVSVDYGSYVDVVLRPGSVHIDGQPVNLQNASQTNIGTAYARNFTPTRLYLFGVKMNSGQSFDDVVRVESTSGYIGIAPGSKVKEVNKAPMIFDTGTFSLKETTDIIIPVREFIDALVTSNEITLVQGSDIGVNEDFALDQSDLVVVDASNTPINVLSWTVSSNGTVLTIQLDPADNSDPVATVYFNKRIGSATPTPKLVAKPYVKVEYDTDQSKYTLGFPDVYKIEEIIDSVTGLDVTDSFALRTNQNDYFYDISYMEYIPGRPRPTDGGQLVIKLNVFQLNTSGGGDGFFTINSYPIDDATEVLPSDKIRSTEINSYVAANGRTYNLRQSFDFRPYRPKDSAANYFAVVPSVAPLLTTQVGAYPNGNFDFSQFRVPALRSSITTDLEFYLSRIDVITMDSYGTLSLVKGEEDERPTAPAVPADELVVSEITIPGYPALSPAEAAAQGKKAHAVKIKSKGTKNYTMRDIEKIEQRIEGLEYYISLNQLEQETENLVILDENGLTRFKNGYIVDPFNDVNVANTDDPNYKAAIHFDKSILTGALNTFALDLKYKSGSSASIFPSTADAEAATLSRNNHVKLLGQPYATNYRNCVSNYWKYDGLVSLSPSHDMAHDTVQNPVPFEIDLVSVFQDLQEFLPITGENVVRTVETGRRWQGRSLVQSRQQTVQQLGAIVSDGGTNQVGDFVTDVRFQPYMRSRDVKIFISGLRPDTKHYFFFDGVSVGQHVFNGSNADSPRGIRKIGVNGADVLTDSNGVLRAVFTIPEGQFYVGDRVLQIADVSTIADFANIESAATSKADATYHAYNIQQTKTTISTRVPEFTEGVRSTTTRNLPGRVIARRGDPLAQTFFIKNGMGRGSNTVYASKIDLYFKRKSDINGVTVMLREVDNGYPAAGILPFSKVHLTPAQVNVSDDASAVTTVDFVAPVRFDVEKEYCVVIMPDANDPNYLHFTSKVGGVDLTPGATQGQSVVQDWGDGVLFTSTNNRAWQSYQDEDIKFTIYRHDFNAETGSVTLTNDDHEFFTLSNWDGRFVSNEFVYQEYALQGSTSGTVSIVDNIVTGTNLGDTYAGGDYIKITNSGGGAADLYRIVTIDSPTQMTVDKPVVSAITNGIGTPVVAGIVSHYNRYNRAEMHVKESSATASKKFTAGSIIKGLTSGKEATIGSIDNINLSYVQPLIQKANDSSTSTLLSGEFTDPVNPINVYEMPMKFGASNAFTRQGVVIYSKSNDILRQKPFDITVSMANQGNTTSSPLVDIELSTLLCYQYKVTNDVATTSKYISKTVELAEDLDAEDMEIFLTGYRPNGSDIKVYIKPQHSQDGAAFDTIDWIELELVEGVNTYSSKTNLNDFREYKYKVADANKDGNGVLQYTSDAGTFSSYKKFAIRIDLLAEDIHIAPIVKDYRGIALT